MKLTIFVLIVFCLRLAVSGDKRADCVAKAIKNGIKLNTKYMDDVKDCMSRISGMDLRFYETVEKYKNLVEKLNNSYKKFDQVCDGIPSVDFYNQIKEVQPIYRKFYGYYWGKGPGNKCLMKTMENMRDAIDKVLNC